MGDGDPTQGARLGLIGLCLSGLAAGCGGYIALESGSFAAAGAAGHVAVGALVWLAVWLRERSRQQAAAEQLEARRLEALAREGRRSLFEGAAPEGEARAAAQRFARLSGNLFAVGVAAAEAGILWGLLSWFPREVRAPTLPAAALLCGSAFALLLLGRYAFALARSGLPAAAAGGRRAVSGALASFLAGLALAAEQGGALLGIDALGYVFVGVAGILGLEALALLLFEAYRPRRPGEEALPPYDSRLLGLVSAPRDLARSIARAVDYQFGFALSQTWFYRFLERWVVPLVGFAGLAFWLLSTLAVVGPHEQALKRRLGRTVGEPLGPGLHFKLPWPLEEIVRAPSARIHTLTTGGQVGERRSQEGVRERALLWSESGQEQHGEGDEEAYVLLPRRARAGEVGEGSTPVNLLVASAALHYRIADPVAFLQRVQDPEAVLTALTERELAFSFSAEDLDVLLRGRGRHARLVSERVAASARALDLGLEVQSASLTDLHPPAEIGEDFEAVTKAIEESEAALLAARVHAARLGPRSEAEAHRILSRARSRARALTLLAQADAARFAALLALDRAAPGLFRLTRLLEELAVRSAGRRKLVLGSRGVTTTDLDLQERVSVEDIGLGEELLPEAEETPEEEQ